MHADTDAAAWSLNRPLGPHAFASLGVVVAALLVQRSFVGDHQELIPWLWGGVGVVASIVWLWTGRRVPPPPTPGTIELPAITTTRHRAFLAVLCAAIATLGSGVVLLWQDLLSSTGAWLWFIGLIALAVALTAREARVPQLRPRTQAEWLWWWLAALTVTTAFVLRLYRLDTLPPTLLQDEGSIADWGLNYLHHVPVAGQHVATAIPLFRNGANAYTLLGSYVSALVMQFVGETTFGLRLPAAICGGITVWIFYLVTSAYLSRGAAVASTFLLAVGHVHVHWTRLGFLQSMTTLAATLVIWLTLRGLRSPGYLSWVLAGLCLGLAQYLYEGARFLVPILVLFFAYMAITQPRFIHRRAAHVAAMAVTATVVFAPLGFWYRQNPSALLERSRQMFLFGQPAYRESCYPGLNTAEVVLAQLRRSLLGFAYFGDGSGAFDELQVPLVDPVTGALLLAGILGFSLRPRRPVDALVAIWIWVPIAISCTVTIDPPPMTRLIMAFPALFFVAGAMLQRLGWLVRQVARAHALINASLALVIAGLGWAAIWNCRSFFVDYPRISPANVWTEAGRLARAAGPTSKTYMVSPMHLYFHAPEMRFLARGLAGADVPLDGVPVHERGYRNALFLVSPALPDQLSKLRAAYPNGRLTEQRDSRGVLLFTVYRVDAAGMNASAGTDAPWQQHDLRFGMGGKRRGEFQDPSGLAVGPHGLIYVADTGNGRIDVYDPAGEPVSVLGKRGRGEREFSNLCAVAAAPDDSVVGLDCETHFVKRFDRSGQWLGNLGGPSQLTTPTALAVAADGSVLVTDTAQHAVLRFDPRGGLIARAGPGDGPGQLVRPDAVAVAADGTVYVVDNASARVQRRSAQLEYQSQWSLPQAQAGVAITVANADEGAVYVTNPAQRHVQRYSPDGRAEWTVGAQANDPFSLIRPTGVATDAVGNVYVLDSGRNQIFRYDVPRRPH